jgi:hypothetical protein
MSTIIRTTRTATASIVALVRRRFAVKQPDDHRWYACDLACF